MFRLLPLATTPVRKNLVRLAFALARTKLSDPDEARAYWADLEAGRPTPTVVPRSPSSPSNGLGPTSPALSPAQIAVWAKIYGPGPLSGGTVANLPTTTPAVTPVSTPMPPQSEADGKRALRLVALRHQADELLYSSALDLGGLEDLVTEDGASECALALETQVRHLARNLRNRADDAKVAAAAPLKLKSRWEQHNWLLPGIPAALYGLIGLGLVVTNHLVGFMYLGGAIAFALFTAHLLRARQRKLMALRASRLAPIGLMEESLAQIHALLNDREATFAIGPGAEPGANRLDELGLRAALTGKLALCSKEDGTIADIHYFLRACHDLFTYGADLNRGGPMAVCLPTPMIRRLLDDRCEQVCGGFFNRAGLLEGSENPEGLENLEEGSQVGEIYGFELRIGSEGMLEIRGMLSGEEDLTVWRLAAKSPPAGALRSSGGPPQVLCAPDAPDHQLDQRGQVALRSELDLAALLGEAQREGSARSLDPVAGISRDPAYQVDDLSVVGGDVMLEERLVMGNAIAQLT